MAGFELTNLKRRRSRDVPVGDCFDDDDGSVSSSSVSSTSERSFSSSSSSSSSGADSDDSSFQLDSYRYDSSDEENDDENDYGRSGNGEYGYYNLGGGIRLLRRRRRLLRNLNSRASRLLTSVRSFCRSRRARSLLFSLLPLGLFLYTWDVTIHSGKHTTAVDSYPSHFATTTTTTTPADSILPSWNHTFSTGKWDHNETSASLPMHGLWIQCTSWHDDDDDGGIPEWHESLSKVLSVAKSLDAVLVEPVVSNAKLVRCDDEATDDRLLFGNHPVELAEIYNRSILADYYPKLASCAQYRKATNQLTLPTVFDVCLDDNDDDGCPSSGGSSCYGLKECPALDRAIDFAEQNPHATVLVRLHGVRASSFHPKLSRVVRRKQGVATRRFATPLLAHSREFADSRLVFAAPRNYGPLEEVLGGGGGVFGIVRWSPDAQDHPRYSECAKDAVVASEAMALPPGSPFVLLSSLSEEDDASSALSPPTNALGDSVAAFAAGEALSVLFDEHGFVSTLRLLPGLGDPVHYQVLDLLLIERAASVAACLAEACRKRPYRSCQRCNGGATPHDERFLRFALHRRSLYQSRQPSPPPPPNDDPNTLACWPRDSSQLEGIQRLWKDNYG